MTKVQARASRDGALLPGWLNRPLCRRYVLGIFDVAAVRWRDADGCRDRPVHWGIGWLADGECDFLGAWIEPERDSEGPPRMFADLKSRGVERIRHVAGAAVGDLHQRASAAFPGAAVGASFDGPLTEAIARSQRCEQPSPGCVAEQVREGLIRSLRLRRGFESESAVLDFFACALQRMERRLDRGDAMATVRARLDPGTLMVARP